MSRAGVRPDISERVLHHVVVGVQGVYDRHHYTDEKREAFEALARRVKRIVEPEDNVIQLEMVRHTAIEPERGRQRVWLLALVP